jgi:hypothetical protein
MGKAENRKPDYRTGAPPVAMPSMLTSEKSVSRTARTGGGATMIRWGENETEWRRNWKGLLPGRVLEPALVL